MRLKLLEKKVETQGIETFIFQPQEAVTWKAGQFFHYVLHHEPTDDRGSDRWFTNSAAPFENVVRITTRFTDEKRSTFKKALRNLPVGESIEVSDLDGDFTLDDPNKQYVFIAGGIGVTPFRSIIKELDHGGQPINITLLYANRDQQIAFKDEFEAIAKNHPEFQIHYIFSPEHVGESKIRQFVPDITQPIFYVSGPEPMVESLGNMLKSMGIAEDHIKQDWFPGYPAE